MSEVDIIIESDGTIVFVHDDDIAEAFAGEDMTTRRASHVEPSPGGDWTADLGPVGGPVLGPYKRRSEALAAEVAWLTEHMTDSRLEVR